VKVVQHTVVATINNCNGTPPEINTVPLATQSGQIITLDLIPLITITNSSLNLSTLEVIDQPGSGATATIDSNGILTIDYTGLNFTGSELITIQACDTNGLCAQQVFTIEVSAGIIIYNAISANGDELNKIFRIENIASTPDTQNNTVTIYNRWGSKVFEVENYNNTDRVFKGLNDNGNELPSGTYFYKIQFTSGRSSESGYLQLKR
jgi:gliding motility-associated-like protein